MKRRAFMAMLGGAAAWPLAARAQQPPMPVIGFVSSFTTNPKFLAGFRQGLEEAGYVEGRNVGIEYRWAGEGQYDQLPSLLADLVGRRVAVILASPVPAALAAKAITTTIPIVFAIGSDPTESGLVTSLNRPGGNITGVSFRSLTLGAKRIELLRELIPKLASVALLVNPKNPNAEPQIRDTQSAVAAVGLQLKVLRAGSKDDLDAAFASLNGSSADAMVVSADPFFISSRDQIVALAARRAVPAIYYAQEFVAAGGLMSYGTNLADAHRIAGLYVGRILNGEKPGELPVMLSDKFELVINVKTARTLGLTIPPTLLVAADEVAD